MLGFRQLCLGLGIDLGDTGEKSIQIIDLIFSLVKYGIFCSPRLSTAGASPIMRLESKSLCCAFLTVGCCDGYERWLVYVLLLLHHQALASTTLHDHWGLP